MATTHSLFQRLKRCDYTHFLKYDLILDEVLTPIKVIDMTPDDIGIAFEHGLLVENNSSGEVTYTGDDYNGEYYKKLKHYCDTANVIYLDGRLLVWAFPPQIFKSFKSIKVLTYLFEGSLLEAYFRYYDIDFEIEHQSDKDQMEKKKQIKLLLNIYNGSKNKVGDNYYAFSLSWLKKQSKNDLSKISKSVSNLIQTKYKTKTNENAFTTFKDFKGKLKGKGYTSGFIPVNERATNKYSEKETMVYLANRFIKPELKMFFNNRSIQVDEEQWALAELIQWIWRGSIRKGEPMNLFIPSKRMRELLNDWIDDVPQEVSNVIAA